MRSYDDVKHMSLDELRGHYGKPQEHAMEVNGVNVSRSFMSFIIRCPRHD